MSIGLRRNAVLWGNLVAPNTNSAGSSLSAAATWSAFSFWVDRDRTLNKLKASLSSTGSPAAADLRAELYDATTAGVPNTSLGTFGTASGTSGIVEWGGLSVALTNHTLYWIVFKNLNATPASNNYSVANLTDDGLPQQVSGALSTGNSVLGWGTARSTNSGSTWGSVTASASGIRLEFADGYFEGWGAFGVSTSTNAHVYSNRESGIKFASPPVDISVRGVSLQLLRNGSPTGLLRYRIYLGETPILLATTQTLTNARVLNITTAPPGNWVPLYFAAVQTIPANSVVRVVASETTQSDASTNRIAHRNFDVENDANSKLLCGSFYRTLSTDGGASFTDTDTEIGPFALILDSEGGSGVGIGGEVSVPRRSLNANLLRYRRGHLA